jgi:hypothetical protein
MMYDPSYNIIRMILTYVAALWSSMRPREQAQRWYDGVQSRVDSHRQLVMLNLGLLMGTVSSFGIKAILCRCNPFSS